MATDYTDALRAIGPRVTLADIARAIQRTERQARHRIRGCRVIETLPAGGPDAPPGRGRPRNCYDCTEVAAALLDWQERHPEI